MRRFDRQGPPGHASPGLKLKRPPLRLQPTTLWDYPSQDYGEGQQGRPGYKGATPSYIIWNLLQRYTKEKDLVVDSFAGSGTTLDVARDLNRKALGYDVHPGRKDIYRVDARKLPPELTGKVRSEERRVGKECRSRWARDHEKKKRKRQKMN